MTEPNEEQAAKRCPECGSDDRNSRMCSASKACAEMPHKPNYSVFACKNSWHYGPSQAETAPTQPTKTVACPLCHNVREDVANPPVSSPSGEITPPDPFSKKYKNRHGDPVSDACGDEKHFECNQDLTKCHCMVRCGHNDAIAQHAYASPPIKPPDPTICRELMTHPTIGVQLWCDQPKGHTGTHSCTFYNSAFPAAGVAASSPDEPAQVADALEAEAIAWLRENGFPPGAPMHFQIGVRGERGERFGYKYPCEVLAEFVKSREPVGSTEESKVAQHEAINARLAISCRDSGIRLSKPAKTWDDALFEIISEARVAFRADSSTRQTKALEEILRLATVELNGSAAAFYITNRHDIKRVAEAALAARSTLPGNQDGER